MKISVFGTGYVGLVTGACLADIGHEIMCIDINEEKIENLKKGIIPIYELGLEEIVKKNIRNGRLHFTTDQRVGVNFGSVIFNAVGTPPDKNNSNKADLTYIKEVCKTFGTYITENKILINKSTVPVGTAKLCKEIIKNELQKRNTDIPFSVVSNPEFLREGTAVKDFMLPERIVCGVENNNSKKVMEEIYKPITRNYSQIFFTSLESAELIKYAANTFLAVKISFINEIANFAEIVGADIKEVSKGMGLDSRIGKRFLHAGIGYGGSCFPKDIQALIESGKEVGYDFLIPKATENINSRQKNIIVDKIRNISPLLGKKVTIWGTSFKPKTDDVRESPAIDIISTLIEHNVTKIDIFDPMSQENFKSIFPESPIIGYHDNMYEALTGSDILVIVTEWDEFRISDIKKIKSLMKGNIIADGRNIWDKKDITKEGFTYIGIGI